MCCASKHFHIAVTLLLLGWAVTTVSTQAPTRFHGRLSIVPVDFSTVGTTSGSGEVTAKIQGRDLQLELQFAGLSSQATRAEIRAGAKGQRGPVEFAFNVPAVQLTTERLHHTVTLTDTQLHELQEERYYLQIQTTGNPDGEIRGWLLRDE